MYPLLRWRLLGAALTIIVYASVYADAIGLTNSLAVRLIPLSALLLLGFVFGPTTFYAPWRIAWRWFPYLNRWFPDLNGVWVGSTRSNWPMVEKLATSALAPQALEQADLDAIPLQRDAVALEISASLFSVKLRVFATSTGGSSHSVTARPWRDQHSGEVHLTNVYQQLVPIPAWTDESVHLGAADLVFDTNEPDKVSGEYWTRRKWRAGLNTAGTIELVRRSDGKDRSKTLKDYALEEKARLAAG